MDHNCQWIISVVIHKSLVEINDYLKSKHDLLEVSFCELSEYREEEMDFHIEKHCKNFKNKINEKSSQIWEIVIE